jgi:hypothetical protein
VICRHVQNEVNIKNDTEGLMEPEVEKLVSSVGGSRCANSSSS